MDVITSILNAGFDEFLRKYPVSDHPMSFGRILMGFKGIIEMFWNPSVTITITYRGS